MIDCKVLLLTKAGLPLIAWEVLKAREKRIRFILFLQYILVLFTEIFSLGPLEVRQIFFLFLFVTFMMPYRNCLALEMHCRSFLPAHRLPDATGIDCGREYAIGYGKANQSTLWVAEALTKSNVLKFEKRIGYRHFEKEEEVDPRDFNFSSVPRYGWQRHERFFYGHKMWEKRKLDVSTLEDPLGEKRFFNMAPWEHLEIEWRHLAVRYGKIYTISGPLEEAEMEEDAAIEGHLRLPGKIWEAIYIPRKRSVVVQICRNYEPAYCYSSSLEGVRKLIGFVPFPGLAEPVARHELFQPVWVE